jgi:CRP-like cAMP-binding protein
VEKQALQSLCKRFATPNGVCALFKGLSEDALGSILSHAAIKNEPEGITIVHQGDVPQYLYLILSGAVQNIRATTGGKETPVRLMGANETFMDAVIFMNAPSPVSARTAESTTILIIPANIVRKMVTLNGYFALNMLQITANFYKKAIHQIESVTAKSPAQRVGYYLLNAYLEQGDPDTTTFRLPHQKSAIASHLGMQPETFSRALAQIKKMGVDIDRETIALKDAYSLCTFCDHDMAAQCRRFGTPECCVDDDGFTVKKSELYS